MANRAYNFLWDNAQKELKEVIFSETHLFSGKAEKDRDLAFKSLSRIYVSYVSIYRKLEECYDQILHPQKRILLRKLLESCIGRILELKHDMVGLDCLEYSYHDETLAEHGLSPSQIELIIPNFVLRDREKEISYWADVINSIKLKMRDSEAERDGEEVSMSLDEAILVIQRHERARQGRLRAELMKDIRRQEQVERNRSKFQTTMNNYVAATKIQSAWKGLITRKRVRELRDKELAFIGMTSSSVVPMDFRNRLEIVKEKRRIIQMDFEKKYQEALIKVKDELKESEGPEMEEIMKEEIREWFQVERDEQGKFPEYPSDDEGGSAAIFNPEYFEDDIGIGGGVEGYSEGLTVKKKEYKPGKENGSADKKSGAGEKEDEEEESGYRLGNSEFIKSLKNSEETYEDVWKDRDENHNKIQSFDKDVIRDAKRLEVEEEIRKRVDDIMREELELLKIAAERDRGKKGKISKKRKKSKKKANKKGKKKKDKDLTPDRTTESLVEELVLNGIIQTYPKIQLKDIQGDISFTASELKKRGIDPKPGAGDIRRTIAEYCILPMASQNLRENTPHIKSVLLVGPEGSGKTTILHAVCAELGATLFDLTASNIVGKYPGKSGLNMLLHLVFKVSKLVQPSVIYIDSADKTFLKKVSKTDKSDPKRLKKDLPRLVRSLASEDRVLLIGASRQPWECEQKGLMQTYQKVLLLPKPEYAHRYSIWKTLITKAGGKLENKYGEKFDLTSLTKISDGYTPGHISYAVSQVLTERRGLQQTQGGRALKPSEFILHLSKCEPVYREEEEALHAWYTKTPLGKKRLKLVEGEEEDGGTSGGGVLNKNEKKKSAKKKK